MEAWGKTNRLKIRIFGSVFSKQKKKHKVSFHWVKGHDGHPQNERCDLLATSAADGDTLFVDEGVGNSIIRYCVK